MAVHRVQGLHGTPQSGKGWKEDGRSRGRGELQYPCYEPIFSAQHSSLSCRGEGVEKKDKPPLAGLALPGMGRGGSGTVLSSLSLKSEGNQRWRDDNDSRLSKDAGRKTALSRSPVCGQQSALMMPYSLSHCQG